MVKKRSGASKLRQKAERRAKEAADVEAPPKGPAIPQKLQHKITKRVRFLERVAGSSRLAVKGGTAKRRAKTSVSERLTDFTSLAASLAEAAEQDEKTAAAKVRKGLGAGGAKKRMRILQQETNRLQQVLGHAQYRANPIAAVTSHLSSTLPAAPEPQKPKAAPQDRKQQKARRKWEQRLKQRDASGMTDD